MKRVYLDNSATTPTRPEVIEAMLPYFNEYFGNPSSIHSFGREVSKGVTEARENVAKLLGAEEPAEIIFTSGGTESDNLAIIGTALAKKDKGNHIITTKIEHHAVLHTCEYLEKYFGCEVTYLPVDEYGMVDPKDVRKAITDKTILITIMFANNEIGTIQPVAEIGKIAKEHGVLFHTDAVQAVGSIPINVQEMNIDMLSLSGHKFNGPKGVGALYVRRGIKLVPHMHGGAQERKRRASTHNTPGIIGLGKAAELALKELDEKREKLTRLRDKLITGIEEKIPEVILNGHRTQRLPNNVNFSFKYIEGESLLLNLDLKGIAASSGSACTSGSLDPSHVLLAIGRSHEVAHGSLRMTLGIYNTEEEINYVLEVLPEIVEKLRQMSPLYKTTNV
ncbi:cysteine desulfurase NifS [Anoxybacter fermentans]|uniref:Cysteine desulfurase IscS n=1 Tax=Anoxybacter fermentans TaxID=1323375 RepID=A0A3Q9HQ87_9FIRM|nr:cysteine desulfurase NifS [Anoxybacter fermentans]AZR73082.1 cysteine desulfurase NifS [Anoxybacter fermentans]